MKELLFVIAELIIYEVMCGYVSGIHKSTTPTFRPHASTTTQLITHHFHTFKLKYNYKIRILSSMSLLYSLKLFTT